MKTKTKRAITELSKVNGGDVQWRENSLVIVKKGKELIVSDFKEHKLSVEYVSTHDLRSYEVHEDNIFDTVFSFLYEYDADDLHPKQPLITLDLLEEEEPPVSFWKSRISKAIRDNEPQVGFEELGGNRISFSVSENYVVLEDVIMLYGTNVYHKNEKVLQHWLHAHAG